MRRVCANQVNCRLPSARRFTHEVALCSRISHSEIQATNFPNNPLTPPTNSNNVKRLTPISHVLPPRYHTPSKFPILTPSPIQAKTSPMKTPDILCIGSVLWDVIGRSPISMRLSSDEPGRITRLPGGVAMNIAVTLRRLNLIPALLTAIGRDSEGDDLIAACARMGMITDFIYRPDDLPTDRYMAIEGANGLIAAIADAHSLEAAGDKILRPLSDGRLGSAAHPYPGQIALDGNLTESLLAEIAHSPLFKKADLRIAPASPAKAERLLPLLTHPNATIYLNLAEASLLAKTCFPDAPTAAKALITRGATRILVTNGSQTTAMGTPDGVITATPPPVLVTRVTGAGDTFMAAHIVAESRGSNPTDALTQALRTAADYVSGEIGS